MVLSKGEVSKSKKFFENINHHSMGYMEQEASLENMEKEVCRAIENGENTLLGKIVSNDLDKVKASLICKAASLNDSIAKSKIKKVVENLSMIVINLILIINPQAIIGSNISELPEAQDLFIEPIKNIVKGIIPFDLPEIKLSSLGKDVGVLGAAFYAIDNEITNNFLYRI